LQTGSVRDVYGEAFEDELSAEELARLRRRVVVRRVVVLLVVVAMVATLVVPVIVRVVRAPAEPDRIVAVYGPSESRRM
jgi:hypothetical protein